MMSEKPRDENDRLKAGTLPSDPESDADPVRPRSGARRAALRLVDGKDVASLPDPHDLHAECALLGILLWCGANAPDLVTVTTVRDLVDAPEHFYSAQNGVVYRAITEVHAAGTPTDPIAVHGALVRKRADHEAGGMAYLDELASGAETANTEKARAWAASIRERFARRRFVESAYKILSDARSGNLTAPDVARNAAAHLVDAAATIGGDAQTVPMKAAISAVIRKSMKPRTDFVATGIRALDEIVGGLFQQETTILAASTSVGKSLLASQIAMNIARANEDLGVVYVTLEMKAESFARRVLASQAQVDARKIRRGLLTLTDSERLTAASLEIAPLAIDFVDTSVQTITSIDASARSVSDKLARGGKRLALIVIDTLGLVKSSASASAKRSREQEVAETSRGLRWLATRHSCHVMALHHLNREGAKREGKSRLPRLFDLRESGATENDADNVLLLHRDRDKAGLFVKGQPAALIVAKSRNDETGACLLGVEPGFARFTDWSGDQDFERWFS